VQTEPKIVAIYSGKDDEPEVALGAVRSLHKGPAALFLQDGSRRGSNKIQPIDGELRFEGESLIVATADPKNVPSVVKSLSSTGAPSIFILKSDLPCPPSPGKSRILARLKRSQRILEAARQDLLEASRLHHPLTAAAEWIIDNPYLIRTQVNEVRRHLPRDYAKLLRTGDSKTGESRAFRLARELAAGADFAIDQGNLSEFLRESQKEKPLTVGELWLFPLLLRVALIEGLADLAKRISRSQNLSELACFWANRLAVSSRGDPAVFDRTVQLLSAEPCAREPYFVIRLSEQLQDEEDALAPLQRWIEKQLNASVSELVRSEHTRESAERLSTANAFGSLRTLARIDFSAIFEAVSAVDAELRLDPAGVYSASDFFTRDRCRKVVEQIARYSGLEEPDVARRAVSLAVGEHAKGTDVIQSQVAYFLLDEGVERLERDTSASIPLRLRGMKLLRRHATPFYLSGITIITACLLALACRFAWEGGVHRPVLLLIPAVLALFPLSELGIQIINSLVIALFPPEPLSKLDFDAGIPREDATLVVVPMMLSGADAVQQELDKLEVRFLANQEAHIQFSLFSDFTDYTEPVAPSDNALLEIARSGIDQLNARYPGGHFLLFHRPRTWSQSEQHWIGQERKRGKIGDLNEYLCGARPDGLLLTGALLDPIQYVITLDSDTQLPPGTARRMIATIAHPLNRAVLDPATHARRRGYTVIQPRVSVALPGAIASRFTRIFAETKGTDPYCKAVSDAHQDLFGEATFHGKAIYDVHAFREATGDRFPAETILSHDLIEGAHAGVGLATDIELFENLPLDYAGYSKREHRWIRGDWQIAPWIFPRVPAPGGRLLSNPLSGINRWRIFDNLRRSLVPIASVLLLLTGWLTGAAHGTWSLVVGLAAVIPTLAPLLDRLARKIQGTALRWRGSEAAFVRAVVAVAFLSHQAWIAADAIVRALYRVCVSRRKLLEWQPAEGGGIFREAHRHSIFLQMLVLSAASLVLLLFLDAKGMFASAAPFLGLWIVAPALVRWLAHPDVPTARRNLNRSDTVYLRLLARRTWRFFDDLVGPHSNWLPPDNTQLALRVEVAQRTSPTNIGLWFTSALAATDLGYLTAEQFLERGEQTMATLAKLERYEGHLLNWYDTQTLQPLAPRYVSTVDSGNLLATLWVVGQGCHQLLRRPLIGHACLRGLQDTLSILHETYGSDPSIAAPLQEVRHLVQKPAHGHFLISRLMAGSRALDRIRDSARWHEASDERAYWALRAASELESWQRCSERYLRWMRTLMQPPDSFLHALSPDAVKMRRKAAHSVPSLLDLANGGSAALRTITGWRNQAGMPREVSAWLDQLIGEIQEASAIAAETVRRFEAFAAACERLAAGMNMSFLYDNDRRLFTVGYTVGGPAQYTSHYDLLASECRLASLVAIAKGDAPVQHWFSMSRTRALVGRHQVLLSWSGTMFEYLMPLIFMRTFDNSLLDLACREAVRQQIAYGEQNQVPWGCSESGFSALDANQIYQYRAFGVPSLALKADVDEDMVVAPYATMLALLVDPPKALGLYESIDFGRENKENGEPGVPIYAYMAHHQGMSLAALDDILHRGIMRQRFHADVRVRAVESLLFEGVPITRPPSEELQPPPSPVRLRVAEEQAERTWKKEDPAFPRVHLQGNGRYALMVTNSGGGYSQWNGFDVTRWRADAAIDRGGSYLYIKDQGSQIVWSPTQQPISGGADENLVRFTADRAEFQRSSRGIESVLAVTVADDDVELRRLTLTNQSKRTRQLEIASYVELAMAPHAWDSAHPAFAKMFVQTERLDGDVLIAWRRKREPGETPIWTAHLITGAEGEIRHETDRAKFLGRGNTPASPDAIRAGLSGSAGTVLDPVFSLSCKLELNPRDRREITFLTIAASSREELLALVEKYRRPEICARAFEIAWTRSQLAFRYLGIGPSAAHRFQELAGYLLFPTPRLRPPADRLAQNQLGQSALWSHGISGDLPIIAVTIADPRNLPLVRELLLAHTFWRLRGFRADLVILNQEGGSYDRPLHHKLQQQIEAHSTETGIDRPGGVFLRDWDALPEQNRQLILASAAVVLAGSRGSLQQQLAGAATTRPLPTPFVPTDGREEPSAPLPFLELPYFNGLGGFTQDGREYGIYLHDRICTPSPWINVIANPGFGTIVSESGLGWTWHGNSQANRLTPWHNDPVTDPQSEVIYLRDDETGAVWTPTALPIREKDAYRARHGQGYSVFEHNSHAIEQELTVFVPVGPHEDAPPPGNDPVKLCRLRLRNASSHVRRLTITYFAEWVLGSSRELQSPHVNVAFDSSSGALLARQTWSGEYTSSVAFAASSPRAASYSGDRVQFLGRAGSVARPAALGRKSLDNRAVAGSDPCAALQVNVTLEPGKSQDIVWMLGQAGTLEDARGLIRRYSDVPAVEDALRRTRDWWEQTLGSLQVRTPVLSVDMLMNRWLQYQALSCRMWARSALYQSSGAFGFRDQLQDSMAVVYTAPELARQHILTAAARQFTQGDVQHWWHAETGAGVRTRCSDDFLWLPAVVAHYIKITGRHDILDAELPFLEAPELADHEQEHMLTPAISAYSAPLWEHCSRALQRGWRLGSHDLPLFGDGDWNDGMNRVGVEGRGESVWLAWFLSSTLVAFSEVAGNRISEQLRQTWRRQALELTSAISKSAWDGEWYLRGFFDDGTPLGSHVNSEAKIDSIAQSWAVLAGAPDPNRAQIAMESAQRILVDDKNQLVKLFTPPFDHSEPYPGYIMGYPPGLRENGGQYTHGSLWMASAWAHLGRGDRAVQLLTLMNPVEHSRDLQAAAVYKGEPYISPADIYTAPGRIGQSGWTWYTGSAAWMYRIWLEDVLGFHLSGSKLTMAPVIPRNWQGFEIRFRYHSATYQIDVVRTDEIEISMDLDGRALEDAELSLKDDGALHKVEVRVPYASVEVPERFLTKVG
jgi:cyclic beta-1,2-glucan synthetase